MTTPPSTLAEYAGIKNYVQVFAQPELLASIKNALILVVFFSFLPVAIPTDPSLC